MTSPRNKRRTSPATEADRNALALVSQVSQSLRSGGSRLTQMLEQIVRFDAAHDAAGKLLQEVQLFDVYQGEHLELGRKSVALGLTLQDFSRTLTDQEVEEVFQELGLNKREAKDLVEMFFEEIRIALEAGHHVKLSGFGNFNLRDKNQRPGRNPKTGEEIPITARRVVTFHPGQKLKARVEAYAGTREQH